jgi:N-acylneuraminate cytidylyltransferase
LHTLAIIPARGGSKGLPRKNILPLCGKPLIAWTIEAALQAETIGRVVVSTDDAEIADVSLRHGAEVVWRPKEISGDTSPSEDALLHVLEQLKATQGIFVFLQCTSPLTLSEDIDGTVRVLDEADSAFTATQWHHFLWSNSEEGAAPLGHSKTHRPMRQQRDPQYLEVGAVYAMKIDGFFQARHRFFGRTGMHIIPPERSLEIDDATDFLIAEALLQKHLNRDMALKLPKKMAALVMDFDGVLTDNRVSVDEDGKESVVCHRGDGWALQRLKDAGIRLLVLTSETNPSVKQR